MTKRQNLGEAGQLVPVATWRVGDLVFQSAALQLAAAGVFGVVSHRVSEGLHEVAMRKALGATVADIRRLVVGQGLFLASIGLPAGISGAAMLAKFLRSMLFDVHPADPLTYVVLTILLCAIVLLCSYLPAQRAMHLDAVAVLNSE